MSNAERVLRTLDARLNAPVDLTLYGRAALALCFPTAPAECAQSQDVDAVLWLGQAEELQARTNFWEAVHQVNAALATEGLYLSHLFTEDQVILRPNWRSCRVALSGTWSHLKLYRLGDLDFVLSKLMRDDPLDRQDALFIIHATGLTLNQIEEAIRSARVPDVPEIREQFESATRKLLSAL